MKAVIGGELLLSASVWDKGLAVVLENLNTTRRAA
jgi:hypothetical protein